MSASELREHLFFKDADTLAFIDSPSYKPAWSLQPSSVQSIGHRIHSWKLLETGSPVLRQLFDQKMQERNIKRHGGLPEGIRYIIDLTPPSTDEDAVLSLTELSCPSGIRTWADSQSRWRLPVECVSGPDTPSLPGEDKGPSDDPSDDPSEYSPSRHRMGIVHVLQVLEDLNPQLNTPCKLWTFFAVAKLYEISTLPKISVRVASWVYEANNKRLIELHPEITYRMAKGIQCDYLLRESFCVLTGEEALLLLRNSGAPTPQKQRITVHGRPQESLDDDDVQRVQYAGKSFLGRIIEQFVELVGTEMNWLKNSSMFRNVLYVPAEKKVVGDLISSLKDFVRASIFATLSQRSTTWLPTKYQFDPSSRYPASDFLNAYGSMPLIERIMTRTFWQHLSEKVFTTYDGEAGLGKLSNCSLAAVGEYMGAFRDQHKATIRIVTASELNSRAFAFNRLVNRLVNPFFSSSSEQRQSSYFTGEADTKIYGTDRCFSVDSFVEEVQIYISTFARNMIMPSRPAISYNLTDTPTLLTEKEYRYLPLWAGGCDDGTGGVYADQIPLAEADGFSAPGPSIHTGSAAPSTIPSIASFLESTIHGASHRATEGIASEVVSINSEAMSEAGNASVADHLGFQKVDDELSFALDTSADDVGSLSFDSDGDSDSDDTVVIDHGDLGEFSDFSEFEELDDDDRVQSLPIRQRGAVA